MATIVTEPFCSTFIHIPKTGGNSITNWLKQNTKSQITKRHQHATVQEVCQGNHSLGPMNREELGLTWCVVRNPWDYCASWYSFKIMLCKFYIVQIHKHPNMKNHRKEKWNLEFQQNKLKRLENGFVPWLKQTGVSPMYSWAKDCDKILKLENIVEDFKFIQNKMNCWEPLGHDNKTLDRKKYQDYYTTQEAIDIVATKFKVDIETYNYDF